MNILIVNKKKKINIVNLFIKKNNNGKFLIVKILKKDNHYD